MSFIKRLPWLASTALAVSAFTFAACSDGGSGTGVDHGEIDIPLSNEITGSSDSNAISSSAEPASSQDAVKSCSSAAESSFSISETSSTATESSSSVSGISSSATESSSTAAMTWRESCLEIINAYRATEGTAALALAAEEKQTCADTQAGKDLESGTAHGNFNLCGEFAQNSGPNINMDRFNSDKAKIAEYYLKMMWEEKELVESGERVIGNDDDYPYIGHYINMHSTSYTKVACGIAVSEDGSTGWLNINFY